MNDGMPRKMKPGKKLGLNISFTVGLSPLASRFISPSVALLRFSHAINGIPHLAHITDNETT